MRTGAIFLLIFAFILGTAAAISVRLAIEASPVELTKEGPTVKILIAEKDIPWGAEVTADAVYFVDVPVNEVPPEALTGFKEVYQRRAAYPIPAGYPICRDFLLDENDAQGNESAFLPAGSRLISLEVEQLRQGVTVSELSEPITNYLAAGQRIVIRAVPAQEAQGVYVERKNQLLKAFMPHNGREEGDVVLDNVKILRVLAKRDDLNSVRQIQSLTLLLKQEEAEKLTETAQKFRLRIAPQPVPLINETATEKPVVEKPTTKETAAIEKIAEEAEEIVAEGVTDEYEIKNDVTIALQADTEKTLLPKYRSASMIDLTASVDEEPLLTVPLKIEPSESGWALIKTQEVEQEVEIENNETKEVPFVAPCPPPVISVGAREGSETQKSGYSPFGVQSRIASEQ